MMPDLPAFALQGPAPRLWLALQAPTPFDPARYGDGGTSLFWTLVQTLLALAIVCGLAVVLFRWVLPRLQQFSAPSGSMVRVVDRVGIEARKSLLVVEVAGRWLLISTSEAGVQLISELDAAAATEAADEMERLRPSLKSVTKTARGAVSDRFARLLNRRR